MLFHREAKTSHQDYHLGIMAADAKGAIIQVRLMEGGVKVGEDTGKHIREVITQERREILTITHRVRFHSHHVCLLLWVEGRKK